MNCSREAHQIALGGPRCTRPTLQHSNTESANSIRLQDPIVSITLLAISLWAGVSNSYPTHRLGRLVRPVSHLGLPVANGQKTPTGKLPLPRVL